MKTTLFLFCVLLCEITQSQNLVPNPSFEEHTGCPFWADEMYYCIDWLNAGGDTLTSTPDYYNECSTNPLVTPPNLWDGYQVPYNGNAYCMLVTYTSAFSWYREYIQAQLIQQLTIGQKYYVSFYISLPGNHGIAYAANKIGALFTTYPFLAPNYATINNAAQVYTDSVVTDTVNWFHLRGTFVADSNYKYISLGNFFDDSLTITINLGGYVSYCSAYYIDDVCVSTDSISCYAEDGVQDITVPELLIHPNPADGFISIEQNSETPIQGFIMNATGQIVTDLSKNRNRNKIYINCSEWADGVYFLKTTRVNQVIIIQHH